MANHRKAKKVCTCKVCGTTFKRRHNGVRENGNKTCSPECRSEAIRQSKLKGEERECEWCGTPSWYAPWQLKKNKRFFCSMDCRKAEWRSRNVTVTCEACGEKRDIPRSLAVTFRYCDRECRAASW